MGLASSDQEHAPDVRLYHSPGGEFVRLEVDRVTGPGGQRWLKSAPYGGTQMVELGHSLELTVSTEIIKM